jgi:energy-coupling factor transporter ATP-binding protein EcfA2
MDIQLKASERWLFVGRTGSGKSTLAKDFLKILAAKNWQIAIIDSVGHDYTLNRKKKHYYNRFKRNQIGTIDDPIIVRQYQKNMKIQLFQPSMPGYDDDELIEYLWACYKQQNMIIYFDEVYGIATQNRYPDVLTVLWTQGRKRNVGAWCSTQRPERIPEFMIGQATNMAIFAMNSQDDRVALYRRVGDERIKEEIPPLYHFFYWNERKERVQLVDYEKK